MRGSRSRQPGRPPATTCESAWTPGPMIRGHGPLRFRRWSSPISAGWPMTRSGWRCRPSSSHHRPRCRSGPAWVRCRSVTVSSWCFVIGGRCGRPRPAATSPISSSTNWPASPRADADPRAGPPPRLSHYCRCDDEAGATHRPQAPAATSSIGQHRPQEPSRVRAQLAIHTLSAPRRRPKRRHLHDRRCRLRQRLALRGTHPTADDGTGPVHGGGLQPLPHHRHVLPHPGLRAHRPEPPRRRVRTDPRVRHRFRRLHR